MEKSDSHFHHDYDTEETLRLESPRGARPVHRVRLQPHHRRATRFAFLHGNFGLDNSNGPFFCGVPNELTMLRELGAFADFTFPSLYQDSQPASSIRSTPPRRRAPKWSDAPLPLSALRPGDAGILMIFEGPLIFNPTLNPRRLFLELDDGDIHPAMQASPRRADAWVRANIHVPQRPEWVFVKLFGHGAESPADMESVTGSEFDEMLGYLEQHYNDGRQGAVAALRHRARGIQHRHGSGRWPLRQSGGLPGLFRAAVPVVVAPDINAGGRSRLIPL